MEYSLYIIKNKINGKCYVGQTKYYPLDRIYQHLRTYKWKKSPFYSALKAYGLDNFELVEIKHTAEKEADRIERDLIKDYNSLHPNGYNILPFGDLSNASPEIFSKLASPRKKKSLSLNHKAKISISRLSNRTQEQLNKILKIKELLTKGLTTSKIAQNIGCSQQYICDIKYGRRGKLK